MIGAICLFSVWAFVGIANLTVEEKISKFSYVCIWLALLIELIINIADKAKIGV